MLIGVFSDAHGHVAGFVSAIKLLKAAGAERLYFLGDAVGYIPNLDVLRLQRKYSDLTCLLGNHEELLLINSTDNCVKDEVYKHSQLRKLLTEDDIDYIKSLPRSLRYAIDGVQVLFVHGSPSNTTYGYVYPDTSLDDFKNFDADVVFMGHTHHYFVRSEYGRIFINVGSCGLPRDTNPRGCAVLFDTRTGSVTELRFSLSLSSKKILESLVVAAPTALYLKRYAAVKEE
jgi:putative phosphoesterase